MIAARYRSFALEQTATSSPTFHDWALHVASSPSLQSRLAPLPRDKQQPNLVFAAARQHGAVPGDTDSLENVLANRWAEVRATILARSTQTNEAARCGALLLGLQQIPDPIALLEIGAAAGLCLIPDRYSYIFNRDRRLDPPTGPSDLIIPITLRGGLVAPSRMPEIVWRAGINLNPLDPADVDAVAWLQALVWPEHEERRQRLRLALRLATREHLSLKRANLLDGLDEMVRDVPPGATLVVTHSAMLAYLDDQGRHEAARLIGATGARHVSFEGRGVVVANGGQRTMTGPPRPVLAATVALPA